MRNNFPNLLRPLTANEKRKFLKSEGLTRERGVALANVHAVGLQSDATEHLFAVVIKKLLCTLHWKHTGKIVLWPEGIIPTWYTNTYAHVFDDNTEEREFYTKLPACPPMRRNAALKHAHCVHQIARAQAICFLPFVGFLFAVGLCDRYVIVPIVGPYVRDTAPNRYLTKGAFAIRNSLSPCCSAQMQGTEREYDRARSCARQTCHPHPNRESDPLPSYHG